MSIEGFWADMTIVTADNLNACLLQTGSGAPAGVVGAAGQQGRYYYDTTNYRMYWDNGSSWNLLLNSDPAVATAGLRTLGTGAQQAAAGNHTHTISSHDLEEFVETNAAASGGTIKSVATYNTETTVLTASPTWAGSNKTRVLTGSYVGMHANVAAKNHVLKLYINGIEVATDTKSFPSPDTGVYRPASQTVTYVETSPTSGHAVSLTGNSDDGTPFLEIGATLVNQVVTI